MIAPEEHMGENVPVVTTSISLAAFAAPLRFTTSVISCAVTTTAFPSLILWLISLIVLDPFPVAKARYLREFPVQKMNHKRFFATLQEKVARAHLSNGRWCPCESRAGASTVAQG